MNFGFPWAFRQWVYVYLFSDASLNVLGYGTFIPDVGPETYQNTIAAAFDLSPY